MDYEKKYNDLVNDLKELWNCHTNNDQLLGELAEICPELRESEDERIRKLLIWQVHRNIEDETNDLAQSVYDGIKGHDPDLEESIEDWKKCLAWLEKQKEPVVDEEGMYYYLGGKFIYCGYPATEVKQKESLRDFIDNFPYSDEQKEQKPADLSEMMVHKEPYIAPVPTPMVADEQKPAEWDDYTKTNLGRAIQIIKDARGTLHGYQTDDGIYECDKAIEALEHFLYRGLEIEKSADWSEEDEKILKGIIGLIDHNQHYDVSNKDMLAWLKSLPERFNLQPKAEWSEEDKMKIVELKTFIAQCNGFNKANRQKAFNMIDALRPVSKESLQSHWKPSEEQMKMLAMFSNLRCVSRQEAATLESLYEQLTKL